MPSEQTTRDLEGSNVEVSIVILRVSSPIVINIPTRDLLAVKTNSSFVSWLAKLQ